jgi:acyl-CoA synthetase (AMP-forming)/AMP-acid ligase II
MRTLPSLNHLLLERAENNPANAALMFLPDGEQLGEQLTFAQLHANASRIASILRSIGNQHDRVLLIYPSSNDYIAGFFGCLYAGLVAIPAYPPRNTHHAERLSKIIADAGAKYVLTLSRFVEDITTRTPLTLPKDGRIIATDSIMDYSETDSLVFPAASDTIAYLQYTSGSTGSPKGVMVSHGNLLHNLEAYRSRAHHHESNTHVSWLPIFHDLGLIKGILQPLYVGATCVFMPPVAFIQKPLRWLKTITDYGAAVSGGPNFAYDLCVDKIGLEERDGLRLDSWRVALNGAEPIRAGTIERFTQEFAPYGFHRKTFFPAYGLAEATLIVSMNEDVDEPRVEHFSQSELEQGHAIAMPESPDTRALVSCGMPWEQDVQVVAPNTRIPCDEGYVGEIWVHGPSVAKGYWANEAATKDTFQARIVGHEIEFMRTGDLGFYREGHLYITGRLKDLIIIRGANHYPQDIEFTVERAYPGLNKTFGAAFSIVADGKDRLIVVQEVERSVRGTIDAQRAMESIRAAVAKKNGVEVHGIVLLPPASIQKTSSGKIQRQACKTEYLSGRLNVLAQWTKPPTM